MIIELWTDVKIKSAVLSLLAVIFAELISFFAFVIAYSNTIIAKAFVLLKTLLIIYALFTSSYVIVASLMQLPKDKHINYLALVIALLALFLMAVQYNFHSVI